MDEAEYTLLEHTRLVDLIGERVCVSVPADDLSAEKEWVLRTRLTAALHQVGLQDYRVELHLTNARGAADAE